MTNKLLFHCCICFLVLFSETLSAQKVNQHTLYQQAQVAFENEAYSDALHYISQLRRVHKNQDYLRLKIQSQFYSINKFSAFDSYDEIVSLKEDVAHYLHNFDTSPNDEIHAINSRLNRETFSPFQAHMGKGYVQYSRKDFENALKWFEKADSIQPNNVALKLMIARLYREEEATVKDYEKSFAIYKELAEQGNADAQNNLAWLYTTGKGVAADPEKGIAWNLKAAEQGNVNAQYTVATQYAKGEYLPKNDSLAFHWHEQAALKGYHFSQVELADMYYHGAGVEASQAEALMWHKKAAQKQNVAAIQKAANMYYYGKGTEKDETEAARWYAQAATLGNTRSQYVLGWLYEHGSGVEQDIDKALHWYERAADNDNTEALFAMACLYQNGVAGIPKNEELAETYYLKAAALGHLNSQIQLGAKYAYGNGVEKSKDNALYWLEKAAEQGSNLALTNLASIYLMGDLVEKDDEKAKYYIEKPLQEDYPLAMLNNALMYAKGIGYEKDEKRAFQLIKELAAMDNARAIYQLALFYENGVGTPKNNEKAISYFEKAAALGNPVAYINISRIYETQQSMEMAKIYLQKGIDNGVEDAKHLYGRLYYEGKSVTQSYAEALRWNNNPNCVGGKFDFALQHYYGKGIAPDTEKAVTLVQEIIDTNEGFVKELYANVSKGGEIQALYPNYADDALAFLTFISDTFALDLE